MRTSSPAARDATAQRAPIASCCPAETDKYPDYEILRHEHFQLLYSYIPRGIKLWQPSFASLAAVDGELWGRDW